MLSVITWMAIIVLLFVIIVFSIWWFDADTVDRRRVRRMRKQWYLKYPIGTNIKLTSQWDTGYYVIVSEKEFLKNYCPGWGRVYLDMNNVLLCAKELATNQYVVFDKDSEKKVKSGEKSIYKVSDVKMKILELERRRGFYENVK